MPDDPDADDDTPKPVPAAPGSLSGRAPEGPLPPLAERIERAKQAADQRRRELGLPEYEMTELEKGWEARWSRKSGRKRRR